MRWPVAVLLSLVLVVTALVRCGADEPTGARFRSADLMRIVEARQIKTLEGVLAAIPEFARRNYVFLERSRSPQKGSGKAPRAIVYSQGARFVYAFNGLSSQAGNDVIEIIEFDDATEKFELRYLDEDEKGGLVRLSEANPGDCVSCHQDPVRPNWDSYPEWPGSWGSDQDLLLPGSGETKHLHAFLKTARRHPRYGTLVGLENYARTRHNPDGDDTEGGPTDHRMRHRPNARLTDEFFILNAKRVAREIHSSMLYDQYKWALAAVELRCDPFERYLPKAPKANETRDNFRALLPTLLSLDGIRGAKIVFANGLRRKDYETHPFHNEDVARLQTVAALAGWDFRNWILTPSRNAVLNYRSSETKFTHVTEILQEVLRRDPEMAGWIVDDETPKELRDRYCAELDAKAARRKPE